MSTALLSVVAIISAGILVRLARGVPFSSIEVLKVEEARKLSSAIKISVRTLRALLLVCFLTIFVLVFVRQIDAGFVWLGANDLLPFSDYVDYVAFVIPSALSFLLMRTYAVVDGDIQIADIQADILIKKRSKDVADAFKKDVADPAKASYVQPRGYGGVIETE